MGRYALGVFRAAGIVHDWPHVPTYARDALSESLDWFNNNLIVPRLQETDSRAIFWFRSSVRNVCGGFGK